MPLYAWVCHSCHTTNPADSEACGACGCPAVASVAEIEEAKTGVKQPPRLSRKLAGSAARRNCVASFVEEASRLCPPSNAGGRCSLRLERHILFLTWCRAHRAWHRPRRRSLVQPSQGAAVCLAGQLSVASSPKIAA